MLTLMDYPAPVGLLAAAGELKMPFSDSVKYCILGISVMLLLLALGILAWQAYRCCNQTHTTYTQQDTSEYASTYSKTNITAEVGDAWCLINKFISKCKLMSDFYSSEQ